MVIIFTNNRTFSPFYISMDGMLGKEALVLLTNLSPLMAEKHEEHLSHICGWVNGQIVITVARSYSHMILVACLPSILRYHYL